MYMYTKKQSLLLQSWGTKMNIKKYIKINSNLYFKQFDKYIKYHIAYFVIEYTCTINDIHVHKLK